MLSERAISLAELLGKEWSWSMGLIGLGEGNSCTQTMFSKTLYMYLK